MTTMTKTAAKAAKPRSAKKAGKTENSAEIRVRLSAGAKDRAEKFFKRHGLSTSDGVRRLIDSALRDKDPWLAHKMSSHIPNAETAAALRDENLYEISPEDLTKMILGEA